MNNLAIKRKYAVHEMEEGRVVRLDNGLYEVESETGLCTAQKAVSCLVEPEPGDLVLVSRTGFGRGYVLSVLERETGAGVTLSFESDLTVRTPNGRMGVVALEGFDLLSEKEVNLVSSGLGVTASEAKIGIERLSYWGSVWEGGVGFVKLVADRLESFAERFTRIAKHAIRHTEETDLTRCGRFQVQADQSLQLRGDFAQMTAKEDVHIDGERVHIG